MFLKSLTLRNILSFGPEPHTVELGPLNVIIGPNGSGKSNFIEAIGLLKAAPRDIHEPIREGGGIGEWLWKGGEKDPTASIDAEFHSMDDDIRYQCAFSSFASMFNIDSEIISSFTRELKGFPIVVDGTSVSISSTDQSLEKKNLKYDSQRSILSQLREPFAPLSVFFLD